MPSKSAMKQAFEKFLKSNDTILEWSSGKIAIPYTKPTDGKVHDFFPDFYFRYLDKDGTERKVIAQIEHEADTVEPDRKSEGKSALDKKLRYAINVAKWRTAVAFCNENGFEFRILTEKMLFN